MFNMSIIEKIGLHIIKKHDGMFNGSIVETDYKADDSTISKYYIYPIELKTFENICKSEKTYNEFEIEYIEPIFMNIDGDLSWNLYLVFVLSDEDYSQVLNEQRTIAENSKEYARKIVVSCSQFKSDIPVGKLKKADHNIKMDDPREEWYEVLHEENMDFCLGKFSNKNVDEYLASTKIESLLSKHNISNKNRAQEKKPDETVKIKELIIGNNFRPHCFSQNTKFNFSNVNIFEGANGSGKTSVLEAIELAFTGEVQRENMCNKGLLIAKNETVDCLTLDNGKRFDSDLNPAEKKNRESMFYMNREKNIDKLNQAFHQYNYFSSEEVYKFCFDEQPDFNAAFSRVIFGEALSTIESDWIRYKKEFSSRQKQIKMDICNVTKNIDMLSEFIANKDEFLLTSLEILSNLLSKLNLKYDQYDSNNSHNLLLWTKNIQARLVELKTSTSFFDEFEEKTVLNVNSLRQRITELESEEEYLSNQKDKLGVFIKDKQEKQLALNKKIIEAENKRKDILKEKDFIRVYLNREKNNKRKQLDRERCLLKNNLRIIDALIKNWGDIIKNGVPTKSEQQLLEQKACCEKTIFKIENQLKINEVKQKAAKSKKMFIENILSEIKVLGERYVTENPDAQKCPLCGFDHKTSAHLKEKIQIEISGNKDDFGILFKEQTALIKCLANNKNLMKSLFNDLEIYRALNSAVQYIFNQQKEFEKIRLDRKASITEYYDAIIRLINSRQEVKLSLYQVDEQVTILEEEGFTLDRIQQANQFFASETTQRITYNMNVHNIKLEIDKQMLFINARSKEITDAIEKYQRAKVEIDAEIVDLNKKMDTVSKSIKNIQFNIGQFKQWERVIRKIINNESKALRECTFKNWSIFLTKAIIENETLQKKLNENIIFKNKTQKLVDLEKEYFKLRGEEDRCKTALKMLSKLYPLSKYSEEFLKKNKGVINDIFLKLHLPNEFDMLDILDKRLVAYRKGSESKCYVHQMSAGQRTALVLSVFFALHLSLPTAPNFILLDEPVANMDDLNVLGLLDFLRQLYLTKKTQIFFTTANPLVASLFRRKFSYLCDDFNSYSFRRNGDKTTKIIYYQYNPNEEDGKKINIIS